MIELTQVKNTDKLGQLQGILNTAFSEIQTDQPFVGVCQNISINFYNSNQLALAVTASELTDEKLYALCYPESNGVFIAKVFGSLQTTISTSSSVTTDKIVIDVPTVKLPTRDSSMSTFVSPSHLGLAPAASPGDQITGPNVIAIGHCWISDLAGNLDAHSRVTIEQHNTTCNVNLLPYLPITFYGGTFNIAF